MKSLFQILLTVLLLASLGCVATACAEEEDCSMTTRAMMQCNLYQVDRNTGYVSRDTLQATLTITPLGVDTVLINRLSQARELSLPFRYTTDTTQFVFEYSDIQSDDYDFGSDNTDGEVLRDTLTVIHQNTPYFISMDCGYQMKQAITEILHTSHLIDSVSIVTPEATYYGKENIKLFCR